MNNKISSMTNRLTYIKHILLTLCLLLWGITDLYAQTPVVLKRFVKTSLTGGSSSNHGTSFVDAMDNLQEAINSLRTEMQTRGVDYGVVYVAEGKYNPTESTERQNSNILNTSFLIYEGITIYGGYKGDETGDDLLPENRERVSSGRDVEGEDVVNPWDMKYKTVLSGNHSSLEVEVQYSPTRGQYQFRFPSSSFHVVWFGTNGEIDNAIKGHRNGLSVPAAIDGCTIEDGNASSKALTGHNHMGYGGGVYMVEGSYLRNCIVQRCQATLRGGGVYMDGGGEVDHCMIQQCQASGVAIAQGYGGGICIDYNGVVKHSYIVQNASRIGGGLSICHTPGEYPFEDISPYIPFAAGCIIANNTTNAEGGGVYLDEGGTINHCTIVKNNCIGPDITLYGRRHGRSGGVYVRNCGMIYNSVMWGSKCQANNNMQFASIIQAGAATTGIDVYHCALYNQDITDWSNVTKQEVFGVAEYNRPFRSGGTTCCWFEVNDAILDLKPNKMGSLANDLKAGVDYDDETMMPQTAQIVSTWRPRHNSDLAMKGIQVTNHVHINSEWIRHAHTPVDMMGVEFEQVSTLGAIAHDDEDAIHTLMLPQGEEGRALVSPTDDDSIPTIFVSALRDNATLSSENFYGPFGGTWEHSCMLLSDAINYFEEYRVKDMNSPNFNKYKFPDDPKYYPAVQMLVKEGTMTTVGRGNYYGSGDIRTAAIRPKSNMRFYGGYPGHLTETDVSGRDPGAYHTLVSSNIVGSYDNASAHGFGLINVQNVIIDGIRLAYGNVVGMENTDIVTKGTGIMISNTTIDQNERIDMTGNQLRNSVVANTQAYDGAAFYVNALMPKRGGEIVRADLTVKNTIVRNCTSLQDEDMLLNGILPGVIVANGRATINLDHCTIANNEGYPLKTSTASGYEGTITINNSALFANSADVVADRLNITNYAATTGTSGQITGSYNLFDKDAPQEAALTADPTNRYILDTDNTSANYPTFRNPSFNVGHSDGVDRPLYGGTVSYEPLNKNPLVNAADPATMTQRDRSDINFFNYGGAADIGAIENTSLPPNGTVLYVTPDGAGKRDGSSWGNAIAGNTIYRLNGAGAAGTDELDGDRIINSDPLIGTGAAHGVLTTDNRYQGGYAIYSNVTAKTYLTSNSDYYYTEKNIYTGGGPWDGEKTLRNNEHESVDITDELTETVTHVSDERAANPTYPYGELSGASRTFWRANPYEGVPSDYNITTFRNAVQANNWINNSRKENYVSGLQYAVEMASAYNTLPIGSPMRTEGIDAVSVWVGNGKYTDYKGFVMRDKTTVMGGFPAVMQDGTLRTPGLNERQALMSAVVNIPKAKQATDYDPLDYETILQISDINPKKSNTEINPAAIRFYDRDQSKEIETHITREEDLNINITHQYVWDGTQEDWTNTKLAYPDFTNNGTNITQQITSNTTTGGVQHRVFGSLIEGKDTWHLTNPSKTNYVANVESKNNNADNVSLTVYDPETGSQLTGSDGSITSNRIFIGNGSLTGLNLWQTIPNLPEGNYQLSIDMAGGYRNKFSAPEATNIFFHIIGADGSERTEPKMLKPHPTNSDDNGTVRKRTYRYVIDFTQPTEGPLTLKVTVEDGLRNTTANNATYGTPSGGDPVDIPKAYSDSYGTNNPNRREFWVSNVHLTKKGVYNLDGTEEERTENSPSTNSEVTTESPLTEGEELKTLRKRVLTMPDITVPTYGGGNIGDPVSKSGFGSDELSHTYRLTGPTKALRKAPKSSELVEDPNYVEYSDVYWDGFTIRHGFLKDEAMAHGGGAGVNMYEGAHLHNCIVTDNFVGSRNNKGGGVFCDGATSTVEGCFILNNTSTRGEQMEQVQLFAGGFFLYEGTCYNTLIANNYAHGFGGGLGLCVGNFYNNTVAYNTSGHSSPNGGIRIATGAQSAILMANTIIYGNNGAAITMTESADYSPFIHCYIQSKSAISAATITNAINPTSAGAGNYGIENTFLNNVAPSIENTPFAADVVNGAYTGDGTENNAKANNDFRLRSGFQKCINSGSTDFEADMLEGLKLKKTEYSESDIKTKGDTRSAYEAAANAVLPHTDVAFDDRVQDCSIDIGAYEYNGAVDIEPDTTTFASQKLAIYYVTQNGFELGNATANSPENAACAPKLQKVLDAAGRYKYSLMTDPEIHPDTKDFTVVVALGGNAKGNTFAYTPERSTDLNHDGDDVLSYSLIVPHGVQLWGGFYSGTGLTPGFYSTQVDTDPDTGDEITTYTMLRDPLRYQTYLSGDVMSSTGASGQAHHVVHFTNDLFDLQERRMGVGGQLEALTLEKDRAVLDGLIITNGYANGAPAGDGSVTQDMNGAAAIVTGFAHVRNCIITGNTATGYGGGLYLQPHALVSGTIVKNNTAVRGGGIYVEQPAGDVVNDNTYAYVLSTTVVGNRATHIGGGLYFESNVRANSSLFWHNSALDKSNVSGWQVQQTGESSSISSVNYPLVYCGVEVTRWEGVNNLLVSASETEGVRWDHQDYYELYNDADAEESLYFPIEMSSVLARSGMTYQNFEDYRTKFPTLELTDIAGYKRLANSVEETVTYDGDDPYSYVRKTKNNALIEMGARVVNSTFEVKIDAQHVMKRLYVVHTEDLEPETARKLQDNAYVDNRGALSDDEWNRTIMYSQMGSCFANPFHRLGDALQYIINVRNHATLGETYKDVRFEIFVTSGTFYPYRNAYGMQAASRSNTFVFPEKVTLVGGVDHTAPYGQDGWGEAGTDESNVTVPIKDDTGLTLKSYKTETIRKRRAQSDLNMNNVVEPWELSRQTILSGSVVSGTETKNAYHVITCYPDDDKVGKLPTMYSDDALTTPTNDRRQESIPSLAERTIFLDGITVVDGMANDLSDEDAHALYQRLTYFRGGGIFVDGNWDQVEELGDYVPEVIGVAKRNIPLAVTNCMFHDNMAGNGGAIYSNGSLMVTSCHFAQNSSRGPNTERDQLYIPWTAGGAIATNFDCRVINTIFANNEAKRGQLPITIPGDEGVEMADIRQGFGGVISASETSTVQVLNCNFVRNKAVAYPAIYNFLDQEEKSEKVAGDYKWEHGEQKHWAVNCIFWGNEKNEDVANGGQVDTYVGNATNDPGSHALGDLFTMARRDDVANFGADTRDKEVLFFCAYEAEHGLASQQMIVADEDHKNDHKKAAVPDWEYFNQGTFVTNPPASWRQDDKVFTHNQVLDDDNNALNGPNFIQPSVQAGIEGYMQNADWLVARLNRLIDNGWSFLPQHVTQSRETYNDEEIDVFHTIFEHSDEHAAVDGTYTYDSPAGEMDNTTLTGSGLYNFLSLGLDQAYGAMGMANLAPLGEHDYMMYERYGEHSGMSNTMRRISTYPKMGEQEVFIDIGVYEYQYVQLFIPGNAYDVIWVRPDNPTDGTVADGSTWAKATNNVQQAIDMLMSSHNNHDKVLKVREGDYSPVYLTHGKLAYYIERTSNINNILYPTGLQVDDRLGVKSFTIRGGYPNEETMDIPDEGEGHDGELVRDPERYPTRFIMTNQSGYEDRPDVKENLFVIQNIELQKASKNFIETNAVDMDGTVVPVNFEGLIFSNPYAAREDNLSDNNNGAAIIYTEQTPSSESVEDNLEDGGTHLGRPGRDYSTDKSNPIDGDGRPKLLIKDCVFLDNSTHLTGTQLPSTAVRVMAGGGPAVIANSLFHSNGGNPIVGVDTKVVNCSFALNGGQLNLSDDESVLHNSVIWCDAVDDETDKPYVFSSSSILGKNNAITDDDDLSDTPDANGNQSLSLTNHDILTGPNFTDPTPTDPWQRNMHPRPTDRLMSKADKATYKAVVPYYDDVRTTTTKSAMVNGEHKEVTVQTVTRTLRTDATDDDWEENEQDLAHTPRFRGKGLERGPYEVQAAVQRVLYVNPSALPSGNNDGASWERAFCEGHLQDAIDAAGVYNATNGDQRAYVIVRGDGYTLNDPVLVRNGVTVYGGVTNITDQATTNGQVDGDYNFREKDIYNYLARVRANRGGVANTAVTSLLRGVQSDGTTSMTSGFVLDGFHITNADEPTDHSPVTLHDQKTLLRNCLIYGNNVTDDLPVVDITHGLLYNSLLYGNQATTIVGVGSGATGGVLNCTVVADEAAQTAITSAVANKVVNTITYNEATQATSGTGTFAYSNTQPGMFAPYLRTGATPYTFPFGERRPLWYQLHEQSACINGGTNSWSDYFSTYANLWEGLCGNATDGWIGTNETTPDPTAQRFIDFGQDRDVLGNPRLLFTTVDHGAFETWRIAGSTATLVTNETETTDADSDGRPDCPITNYGGHRYPHVGSVTYIGQDASLCVKPNNFTAPQYALTPGYLLVEQGGSLYGQGNHIRVPYVAVERNFAADQQYALVSMPFPWQTAHVTSVKPASGDALAATLTTAIEQSQYYDGAQRAQWNYTFRTADSPCWTAVPDDLHNANQGYLLTLDTTPLDTECPLRFTAWGVDENGAEADIYTENGAAKTVALQQYDNMPTDGTAHFTALSHMGWNLSGMPWLVSTYKTGGTSPDYTDCALHVPHLFHKMYGDGTYVRDATLYTQQSWNADATMTLGDAYFTQTAILGATETLTFQQPVYTGTAPTLAARQRVAITRKADAGTDADGEVDRTPVADDVVAIYPRAGVDAALTYQPGSDGTKWFAFDERLPQIYAVTTDHTALSLLAAAPVQTDIPLGFLAPTPGQYTISLPEAEAYADYEAVWLIDHLANTTTDLRQTPYTLTVTDSGADEKRLVLRFGGALTDQLPTPNPQPSVLKVTATHGRLPLPTLDGHTTIHIFTAGGNRVFTGTVAKSRNVQWSPGVYVVKTITQ